MGESESRPRLWLFNDWEIPIREHLHLYKSLRFTDIILGVANNRRVAQINHTYSEWITACDEIRRLEMRPHVLVLALPSAAAMRAYTDMVLNQWQPRGGISSFILEAGGTWHQGTAVDRHNAEQVILDRKHLQGVDIGVTGLSQLHKSVVGLANVCDYLLPQAHSIWKPGEPKHWSHSHSTVPGEQQRAAFKSWVEPRHKAYVMGLSCYWAARPGMSEAQSLQVAYDAALELQQVRSGWSQGIAYWSGKHLRGLSAEKRAHRAFFEGLSSGTTRLKPWACEEGKTS